MQPFSISRLKLRSFRWFETREPLIWAAKNGPEMRHRLVWLSEGCLHYHMSMHVAGSTCYPREKALFAEFVASGPEMLRK